ncbi:MAG: hypothetical protein HY063_05285 [Bacteroidetes bacterium]|nr:hypothetical protein [Bacteroidota bacterium]
MFAVHRQKTNLFADSQAIKKFSGTVAFVPTAFLARQFRTEEKKKQKRNDSFSSDNSFAQTEKQITKTSADSFIFHSRTVTDDKKEQRTANIRFALCGLTF